MKLSHEIVIDADRDTVWAAFMKTANRPRWQGGIESIEPISGEPGEMGATARLQPADGGRVALESITEIRRPEFVAVIVEDGDSRALVVDTFETAGEQQTIWKSWRNINFNGLMKVGAIFRVGSLKRQLEEDMQTFKLMVESDEAGKAA